jgi:replicative superfamily II helicase
MTTSDFWVGKIRDLHGNASFQLDVAQITAKALLDEVSDEKPEIEWKYIPGTIIRNVSAATFALETLCMTDIRSLRDLEIPARQIAQTWEALSKLEEKTSRNTALLNAAIDYELAGYQANSRCLARNIGRSFSNIDTPTFEEIASAFLQRLFIQVRMLSFALQKEPESIAPDQIFKTIAIGIAAEGFSEACKFFLIGDEKGLSNAIKAFSEAEKNFASLGLVREANLARGIESLLPMMHHRSIWTVLSQVVRDNSKWRRYLRLLSRGVGHNILSSPSISEMWPSQLSALEKGLLSSENSKIIKMPTSAGKTRIAELAIVHTLTTKPHSKCVYIAPYRALVYELEESFLDLFGDLGFQVSSVFGNYETDELEDLIDAEADILVLTPEKLDLLQRANPEFLKNVRLFVLDEGQIVQDKTRGVKFEILLTRLKRKLPNARFLFLSAVVPQETLEDFAMWFNANPENDIIITNWRPSTRRIAKFEWRGEKGTIRYMLEEDVSPLKTFVPGVIQQRVYQILNTETGRYNRKRFPEMSNKSQIAAELALKFASLGQVLVFCSKPDYVVGVAKSLQTRLGYAKNTFRSIPSGFIERTSTRSFICAREWLGSNHLITSLLRDGIAIHHGNLPDVLRKAVESDFRKGHFRVLVATNTLAQGVNLPIRTVIVHSSSRFVSPYEPSERIPARDYWNIAGRAGRAGRETEGTIIHIVISNNDERDFRYFVEHREKVEEVKSALFELLEKMVEEGLDESAVVDRLDSEILALLVEENADSLSDETIRSILSETLAQKQADREGRTTENLQKAFKTTADKIVQHVPDRSYWPVYSSTGLKSSSCELLRDFVKANKEKILTLFQSAGSKDLGELVRTFLKACELLPEMASEHEFSGSHAELLESWLSGTDIDDIVREFGSMAPSLEELARFIEVAFTYLLPWGISGFIKIASKELNLKSENISDFVKFFPTMVKFGVPLPVSAWAISTGIPFRKIAIDMAIAYSQDIGDVGITPSMSGFRDWLAKLDQEDLHLRFGLDAAALEDFDRMFSRASVNALLKKFSSSEEILPFDTYVRGIAYEENRIIAASGAKVGQEVELSRDYDNTLDHNAIRVKLNGQTMGNLERDIAQCIAPDLDCGVIFKAKVASVKISKVPKIQIRIEISES